jgi:hypothetical protein
MGNFSQYYFTEAKTKLKKTGWLDSIFSKDRVKTIGIKADKLSKVKRINRASYNSILNALARAYKQKNKETQSTYIQNIYSGKLKDQGMAFEDFVDVEDITIYKTNNGGKIALFNLIATDALNENHYYIGITNKAENFFKKYAGMTFGAFASKADSILKRYEDIKAKKKDPWMTPLQTLDTDKSGKIDKDEKDAWTNKEPSEKQTEEKEYGFVNISELNYKDMVKDWGEGGRLTKKYPNVFKREKFANNLWAGFKYKFIQPRGAIYLVLDENDPEKDGFVIYETKDAKDWAERMGMLDTWIGGIDNPKSLKKITPVWKTLDINNVD